MPAMGMEERVYRRTESGSKALQGRDPALSPEHLRILGLLAEDMHWDEICKTLRRHADWQRLADLEAAGLVASKAAPGADLDFTGNFSFPRAA